MKRNLALTLLAVLSIMKVTSQDIDPNWGIKFTGFVKTDIFYDSRSSTSSGVREGHYYLYPNNAEYDIYGNDITANPSLHMLSIQSRLVGKITGPDAFGAKTSGLIEGEFFGTSESDINGFRLRQAYVKMNWTNTTLLIGQTWHPMFPVESFPGTVSFNTGAPFIPFSRNPQVRITQKLGTGSIALSAYGQRDFTSTGPMGGSNRYLRNSCLPGLDIKLSAPAGDHFAAWAGVDYKTLRPELVTSANAESDATISSFSAFATMKITTSPINISMMGIYGQNATDLVMIGGYAVSGITDPVTQIKTYTNLNTASYWADLKTKGEKVVFGFFTGYTKNLGSSDLIEGAVYGRGTNIDHVFRVSPRIMVTEGRLTFATEVERTTAAYGTMETNGKQWKADDETAGLRD